MTRQKQDLESVLQLLADGKNDCQVSQLTNVPRSTVRDWRAGRYLTSSRRGVDIEACVHDFEGLPAREYSYLLGMYLGDGYIAKDRRVYRLRIVCDTRYVGIIDECRLAMNAVMPGQSAYILQRKSSACVEVAMSSKHWPCLFPQHGAGRKHDRPIRLNRWQRDLIQSETRSFLRGLVHSDGCRVVASDRGVPSVRYHFSNRSEDIKELFCESLDRLEVPWTRPSHRDIAIYRKWAVARLDEFIGPKA